MFVRVAKLPLRPGTIDQVLQTFKEVTGPAIRQQPGCQKGYLLLDRAANQVTSITIWDSEEAAQAYETDRMPALLAVYRQFIAGAPATESYELGVEF
jgi:heme-degrading monooxygenase HmoA